MSIEKYIAGEANELEMRILVGTLGYEIVLYPKGYGLIDREEGNRHEEEIFETIADICKALEPEMMERYGEFSMQNLTEEQKHKNKLKQIVEQLSVLENADKVAIINALSEKIDSGLVLVQYVNVPKDSELYDDGEKMMQIEDAVYLANESEFEFDKKLQKVFGDLINIGVSHVVIGS